MWWTSQGKNKCLIILKTSILRWKSLTKGEISTSTNGWRRRRTPVVSLDGVAGVLGANALTIRTYSPTWIRACVWHNCVDGGGVGLGIDSEHLREVKMCALIGVPHVMPPSCHSCTNASDHKSLCKLSHHLVEERTNTKKGITKKCAKL
jgi:hypothetical protein